MIKAFDVNHHHRQRRERRTYGISKTYLLLLFCYVLHCVLVVVNLLPHPETSIISNEQYLHLSRAVKSYPSINIIRFSLYMKEETTTTITETTRRRRSTGKIAIQQQQQEQHQ
uniref:Uncharacterized protein n=1 Tax=Glossina austeni TaxID=7395 RepID=A0A1A9VKT2_GLOAU